MVKLPEATKTNKLESLPKGLRLQADKIIAKKFKVAEKKPTLDPYGPFGMPQMETRYKKEAHIRNIRYDMHHSGTEVEFMCPTCARSYSLVFSDMELMQMRIFVKPCNQCPTDLEIDVNMVYRHSEQMRRYSGRW